VKWLELGTVLDIYDKLIRTTGGTYGIRDKGLLESALYSPLATFGGEDLYLDTFTKVAVLIFKITNNHPFIDGNKRIAFVIAVTILKLNDYEFNAEQTEIVQFMLRIAQGKSDIIEIEQWLRNHTH
jgi:death-on-curing protein